MNPIRCAIALLIVLFCLPGMADEPIHHQLEVTIDPASGLLQVEDRIRLPDSRREQGYVFSLNKNLNIIDSEPKVKQLARNSVQARYQSTGTANKNQLTLRYQGLLNQGDPEFGIVSNEGVFLSRNSFWFPVFDDELISFSLSIKLPENWHAISQGESSVNTKNKQDVIQWNENQPQDDIYLIAGQYFIEQKNAHGIALQFYSRTKDTELAQRYFQAIKKYLTLYQTLIGAYPYRKFAVVENFWETGYGMPSFTLLGPRVIRFPFILYTSLPHEILHNWWGNGVYVDYQHGNWAEGLTAYLADHLIQEQRGQGADYRRSLLQKYTDYTNSNRDFSLAEFSSRHDTASEAVGYGKSALFFHMLRQKLGDETFVQSLRGFYRNNRFKTASFDDLKISFSNISQEDLDLEFDQWLQRTGSPELHLVRASSTSTHVDFELQQIQAGEPYRLNIPIAVQLKNQQDAFQTQVVMSRKSQRFTLEVPGEATRLIIDPEFDIFRRMQSGEIPSALSQGFGAEQILLVLPRNAPEELIANYRQLAFGWQRRFPGDWRIVFDDEIETLPTDRSIWLLGWNNRFKKTFIQSLRQPGVSISNDKAIIQQQAYNTTSHSLLLTSRQTQNLEHTLLWLATRNPDAIAGLARKLPHYRKYSYLVFEGDAPQNILKGQWPVWGSPMSQVLSEDQETRPLKLSERHSLDVATR